MKPKDIVSNYYKSDVVLDVDTVNGFLHPDVILEWNSSKGFSKFNKKQLLDFSAELSKAYVRSKVRISHIIAENDLVSLRYSHFVKTIENPREEMLLAHFIVIWQIKDNKLFKGYQMSQIS